MRFTQLTPNTNTDILQLIHTNPWRIFDRGIFIPCKELTIDPINQVFEKNQFSPELSFAIYDDNKLKGILFASKQQTEQKNTITIFILEADRTDNFKLIIETMLTELHSRAKKEGINTLQIRPSQPLSTAANLRDDEFVDTLFKMGYWRDITIAAEMKTNLDNWQASEKIISKEKELNQKGIIFKRMKKDDWEKMLELHQREQAHSGWTKLLEDVINQCGPEYIIIAEDKTNNKIIGYATFFARTIFSDLPEYGPVLVDPEYRGMSISSILMKYSVEMIKQIGKAKQIQLSCYPDKFPVYTRQGFYFTNKYLFHATSIIK